MILPYKIVKINETIYEKALALYLDIICTQQRADYYYYYYYPSTNPYSAILKVLWQFQNVLDLIIFPISTEEASYQLLPS